MKVFRPGGFELTKKAADSVHLHGKVLDVGCGLGASLEYLTQRYGIEPHGVDISASTVERAGRGYIICADAQKLPFADDSFDAVMLECVLSLINEPQRAIDEAARVLKTGGAMMIGTLTCESDRLTDSGRVSLKELSGYLSEKGFKITLISDETALLRSFLADIIFEYGSISAYTEAAAEKLGPCALGCSVPKRGTGYGVLTAVKEEKT